MKAVINHPYILTFIIFVTLGGIDSTAADLLVVDKTALELRVYEQDSLIGSFDIACGKHKGTNFKREITELLKGILSFVRYTFLPHGNMTLRMEQGL